MRETREKEWLLREKYGGKETSGFLEDCARLEAGEPLAYVIGFVPFLNAKIWLDSHPLIPRPETEHWVERALRENGKRRFSALDLCAGSGCIGVAVLMAFPDARVDFSEIGPRHHPTIQKNIQENAPHAHARIIGGDLFEHITEAYDLILTNPPYLDPSRSARIERGVLAYEPHHALFGGAGGTEHIDRIIEALPHHLLPGGIAYIEHEPEHAHLVERQAAQSGLACSTLLDQYGVPRTSRLVHAAEDMRQ